jgi:hypothetical protein
MNEQDRIARPSIDPITTPFTATEAFRRYRLITDPDPHADEELYTKAIIREQGFDGLPHVVTRRELDRYVAAGEVELFRGVTEARFADQLRSGDFFVGRGGEVAGMYTAAGPHALVIARQYAAFGDGTVIRMSLKRAARVVQWRELEMQEAVALEGTVAMSADIARAVYNELARLAAFLGYDAIHIVEFPEVDYYVVLNRTALRVQRENVR